MRVQVCNKHRYYQQHNCPRCRAAEQAKVESAEELTDARAAWLDSVVERLHEFQPKGILTHEDREDGAVTG